MVGALLMDVASAFPSMARGCLLRKMRRAGVDENLVRWTDSFMQERSVIMCGWTGWTPPGDHHRPPAGIPSVPVLFNLYIGEIHAAVEDRVPGCQGVSFVDDVTWFVEGSSIAEIRERLEWCAEESLRWARDNAVQFEVSKTEAILLSRKRGAVQVAAAEPVRVGSQEVPFSSEATRWLGVWMDSALTLRTSRRKALNRARAKEAAIRRLVARNGLSPAAARNLQQAIISGTMLYAQQLSWDGSKKTERETQVVLNRMGRASLGVRQTTPLGIVAAESGLTPARALLDHTQARFAIRLLARPQGGGGQEEIMEKRSSALTARLRGKAGLKRRETCEEQVWDSFRNFQGEVHVESKEEALRTAQEWADGSRLEGGEVGAAWAWWQDGEWRGEGLFLGTNKEVFDAEVYAIGRAVRLLNERGEEGQSYTIFSDSQAAIFRVQHEECGPAQALARAAVESSYELVSRGNRITIRWTPSHQEVDGNERADALARRAPPESWRQRTQPTSERPVYHTSPDEPRRPGLSKRTVGSEAMSREGTVTAPPQGEGCAWSSEECARSWRAVTTSYYRATRPRPHTS